MCTRPYNSRKKHSKPCGVIMILLLHQDFLFGLRLNVSRFSISQFFLTMQTSFNDGACEPRKCTG